MSENEIKPVPDIPTKSSMQILSELFSTFDAEPPVIVKKEIDENEEHVTKKNKKSKKKHKKHKDKKHKKKSKKRKRSSGSSSDSDSEVDLSKILIKQETESAEKKIRIEGTSLSLDILNVKIDIKKENSTETQDKNEASNIDDKRNKIIIRDLKYSSVLDSTDNTNMSNGEVYQKKDKKHKSHKHKCDREKRTRSRSKDHSETKKLKLDDLRNKINREHKSTERSRQKNRDDEFYKCEHKHRDRGRSRDRKSKDRNEDFRRYREKDDMIREFEKYRDRRKDNPFYKEDSYYRSRDREKDDKWFTRDRYRGYDERDRIHARYKNTLQGKDSSYIDKKKLLEIARKNAIQMMKSGSLPDALSLGHKAQEKVIAAIKSGGKTVEELTDFCKSLSKKEELGELSSLSEKEDSENDEPFHHPFQIKDRPTAITMNIKNSVPLPIKSTQERTSELRMQFPVSSGQQHRKNEAEWVPVDPPSATVKKDNAPKHATPGAPLAIEAPPSQPDVVPAPQNAPPGPQVFPTSILESTVDIGSIVSQRLTAMRKLQENPNDVQALTQIYRSNKEMQSWAESKQQPGQFTGSTGASILSHAELSSGYQAWTKKDQLQSAAPVSGGMGMHLLQKMGWKPGEGLGKEKTGTLEPLLLEVKLDKKGLVANEEAQKVGKKKQKGQPTVKSLQGKHPVSLLGEYASKRKFGAPQYILEFECGPDHKKNFLYKVVLNGMEYKPNIASNNKKEAKAAAATVALQQIGLLP